MIHSIQKHTRRFICVAMMAAAVTLSPLGFAADAWSPFVGVYTGTATAQTDDGDQQRDLTVRITEQSEGFRVEWKTSRIKVSGKIKRDSYSINFGKTDRPNIYSSAMKSNLFGGMQPLDPMKGEPYVWGRIEGQVLTIYAMLVTDNGTYEMQIYERTLTPTGMDLNFVRYHRAEILSEVQASLKRQ